MADFYIHATRFEGKSIAIQEAQVLGCAIAASDCSGNREQIVSGVDGLLCPFSPEGIANAVNNANLGITVAVKDISINDDKESAQITFLYGYTKKTVTVNK